MAQHGTLIAALKYEGGIAIGSDSQATASEKGTRWPTEKLHQVAGFPCVIGFSGSASMIQKALERINNEGHFRDTTFQKLTRTRGLFESCLKPVCEEVAVTNATATLRRDAVDLQGLFAVWSEGQPCILECFSNGKVETHTRFYSIGSAGPSADVVYWTLGGDELPLLGEQQALNALLRILRTAIRVSAFGVSEPIDLWSVSINGAAQVSRDRMETLNQWVAEWEGDDRRAFLSRV